MPGQVVYRDVKMANARRDGQRRRPAYRHDVQVLRPVLDNDAPVHERLREWRIDYDLRRGLARQRHHRRRGLSKSSGNYGHHHTRLSEGRFHWIFHLL